MTLLRDLEAIRPDQTNLPEVRWIPDETGAAEAISRIATGRCRGV